MALIAASGCSSNHLNPGDQTQCQSWEIDDKAQWSGATAEHSGTSVQQTLPLGGRSDLLGNGALLLAKVDPVALFSTVDHFENSGEWMSRWHNTERLMRVESAAVTYRVYGKPQDMSGGWTKFTGNPLACEHNYKHATAESLQLPPEYPGNPADQSLVRGEGRLEGKWLLVFNMGGGAKNGIGMAEADSLHPLKAGVNPFRFSQPLPLVPAWGGGGSPNDLIFARGLWYAPSESSAGSLMWTTPNLTEWTRHKTLSGILSRDSGMVFDGQRFHLFNEADEYTEHGVADDPLGKWKVTGAVLREAGHTGDVDVAFFNNRWHMFFDDLAENAYSIGYAWTKPSQFPRGWRITPKIIGPHNPPGQLWDDATPEGNDFGTGDADVVLQDQTLYLSYEWPVGFAFKELEVLDSGEQLAQFLIEVDSDGDNAVDASTDWIPMAAGDRTVGLSADNLTGQHFRLRVRLETKNPNESPMVERLLLRLGPASAPAGDD
jgi:hypothetical protein